MAYSQEHTEDECDKCLTNVGKKNLLRCPFVYMDKNDTKHADVGLQEPGYRQYYLCQECYKKEVKR